MLLLLQVETLVLKYMNSSLVCLVKFLNKKTSDAFSAFYNIHLRLKLPLKL